MNAPTKSCRKELKGFPQDLEVPTLLAPSPGRERELLGRCISSLAYKAGSESRREGPEGSVLWRYAFYQQPQDAGGNSFQELGIAEGELAVASIEGALTHQCLCNMTSMSQSGFCDSNHTCVRRKAIGLLVAPPISKCSSQLYEFEWKPADCRHPV